MELRSLVDAPLETTASMNPNSNALLLLQKLRLAADLLCNEYKLMDAENIAHGGETGAIVINQVDKHIMDVLELLREAFRLGLKQKTGMFSGFSEPLLLRLLSEITLKSTFQEIISLNLQVDPVFESDPRHLEMAWFMMALNDVALPQYVEIIRQNPTLAREFYDVDESILLSETLRRLFAKIVHDIESVYFDLDFQSYVDFVKKIEIMGIINSSSVSITSVNQTLGSLKANGSADNLYEAGVAASPLPESNKSSCLSEQPGNLQAAPSTGDTQSLKGSTRSTSPRKSSPLKDSMILPDHKEQELDDEGGEDEGEISALLINLNVVTEDQQEFEDAYSAIATSETRTTEPFYSSPETTLTSLSGSEEDEEIAEDEPTPATLTSTSTTTDLGFFGFPVPGILHNQSSLLRNAIGLIGHQLPHLNPPLDPQIASIPGDFEKIDRVAEKEKLCLSCYDSSSQLKICPISGMGSQHFRCHDCQNIIGIGDYPEAKLCELSGYYFCFDCHADDKAFSPALIINNWDFRNISVSKSLYNVCGSESRSKLFDLEKLNPDLFVYVGELQDIKQLRLTLSRYASAFMLCTEEARLEIVQRIWPREHLIETVNLYTIEDLSEVRFGRLLEELKDWLRLIKKHVTKECSDCQKRNSRLMN
jgi:hypothetical protein